MHDLFSVYVPLRIPEATVLNSVGLSQASRKPNGRSQLFSFSCQRFDCWHSARERNYCESIYSVNSRLSYVDLSKHIDCVSDWFQISLLLYIVVIVINHVKTVISGNFYLRGSNFNIVVDSSTRRIIKILYYC